MIIHPAELVATNHHVAHHYVEAGALRVIRNAVLVVLVIVFLVGGFLGFVAGRAFGRRENR